MPVTLTVTVREQLRDLPAASGGLFIALLVFPFFVCLRNILFFLFFFFSYFLAAPRWHMGFQFPKQGLNLGPLHWKRGV